MQNVIEFLIELNTFHRMNICLKHYSIVFSRALHVHACRQTCMLYVEYMCNHGNVKYIPRDGGITSSFVNLTK